MGNGCEAPSKLNFFVCGTLAGDLPGGGGHRDIYMCAGQGHNAQHRNNWWIITDEQVSELKCLTEFNKTCNEVGLTVRGD